MSALGHKRTSGSRHGMFTYPQTEVLGLGIWLKASRPGTELARHKLLICNNAPEKFNPNTFLVSKEMKKKEN